MSCAPLAHSGLALSQAVVLQPLPIARTRADRDIGLCLALSLGYGAVGTWLCGRLVTSARTHATLALT